MKLTLKFIFISAAVLVTGFNMHEAKAQSVKCFDVSSRTGWQYFDLGGSYTRIASVSGGWSVDARSYAPVGSQGHNEPGLEPYNQYKYDQGYPFGALFVDIPTDGYGYVWVGGFNNYLNQSLGLLYELTMLTMH